MKRLDPEKLSRLISAHAQAELDDGKIGLKEIVVHQNGEQIYRGVFRYSSPDGAPARENTLFRVASMTKPVTAVAVLQLWERGLLDLDEPVSRFYPCMESPRIAVIENGGIVSTAPAKNTIRVSDLLSHTSGVGCAPVDALLPATNRVPLKEAVRIISGDPLAFEPRSAQAYSATAAFDLAAGIVETVSGTAFDDYLEKNVFAPLGMTDTTFAPTKEQWARMAPMHDRTADGKSVCAQTAEGCVFEDFILERMAAGAGLASTAEDYIRFAEMLCSCGRTREGGRVLSERAVARMSAPNVPEGLMGCEKWGLGVRVITGADYPHGLGVGCFGWSGAYGTHFWVDPENGISAVMMKNSRYDGGAGNRSACEFERDVSAALRDRS